MIHKLTKTAAWAVKNPTQAIKNAESHARLIAKLGSAQYRAERGMPTSHQFGCGIKTAYSRFEIDSWTIRHRLPIVMVLVGDAISREQSLQLIALQRELGCHFFAAPNVATRITADAQNEALTTALESLSDATTLSFANLRSAVMQTHMHNDIVLVDMAEKTPSAMYVADMQFVAHNYHHQAAIITPSYTGENSRYGGVEFNRTERRFEWIQSPTYDIGQLDIPRYTLNAHWHGVYVRASALSDTVFSSKMLDVGLQQGFSRFVASAWQQNIRTLAYTPQRLPLRALPQFKFLDVHEKWLLNRTVTNSKGKTRVIYVLNATSVSGGIKTVFEHVNGLLKRGFAVEIWSLQGQPDWMDVDVTVKKFYNYEDFDTALANEDAIKVATWWETSQPVWLASVNRGIGVNFIQEFEPWFYPDDASARAAVVSTYRKELVSTTTTSYNQDELEAIGLRDMKIIPVGYDGSVYHEDKKVPRASDTMLAVGRSFFQKNFEFTKQAWLSLGDKRPALTLFGSEPDILHDERASYHVKPTNEEVNTLYNTATLMVQTSRHEGFCLPAIEAMAAGCPLICTDMHGNRDFCIDGETCLMVEHDNIAQLAGAIERLKEDTELQAKLRKNGLVMAKKYEWSAIIDRVGEFYKSLS